MALTRKLTAKIHEYLSELKNLPKNEYKRSLQLLFTIINKVFEKHHIDKKYTDLNYAKVYRKFDKFHSASTCIQILEFCGFKKCINSNMEERLKMNNIYDNSWHLNTVYNKIIVLQNEHDNVTNAAIIDQLTEHTVFGYIRESQALFPNTATYFNIPKLVKVLCLTYYYKQRENQNKECFTAHTQRVSLNNSKTIFVKTGLEHDTIYGNIIIDSSYPVIYEWEIEILRYAWDHSKGISIGIDSSNKKCTAHHSFSKRFYEHLACIGYAYNSTGNKIGPDSYHYTFEYEQYGMGDIIGMELNVFDKTLTFRKNNKRVGIVFNIDLEDKQYHLAIGMDEDDTIVKIKSFKQRIN